MRLAPSTERKHRYQTCQDEDCPLPYCRIFKEGVEVGYSRGFGAGYGAGHADAYAQGYADGQADARE
jgi:hypothetical protein